MKHFRAAGGGGQSEMREPPSQLMLPLVVFRVPLSGVTV